jgi:hypothetical protein
MSLPIAKQPAPAAASVLRQATALCPQRQKASDGLLPSAAHQLQNPNSDHNTGFAVDLTHDKLGGIDCFVLFQKLKTDPRVKYLIFSGKIWSKERATDGDRPYDGPNKHPHHLHISINENCGNDTSPWFPWMGKPTLVNKVKANLPKPLPKKENK